MDNADPKLETGNESFYNSVRGSPSEIPTLKPQLHSLRYSLSA